jgi:nucleotide-binding universal stress UspA family protein
MRDVFASIVCGIDESPEGLEALFQAEQLRPPGSALHLVAVEEARAASRRSGSPVLVQATGARDALARALEHVTDATSRLVEGVPADCLLREAEEADATTIVVGSHGQSRLAGLFLGSTSISLLHRAPISVLVARRPRGRLEFPASILVGVDGSPESLRALEVANELGSRLEVAVQPVVASGGKPVFWDRLQDLPGLKATRDDPVEALVELGAGADLLVLGSRGLHGLAALGSVSERVASRAFCSVLVVRAAQS